MLQGIEAGRHELRFEHSGFKMRTIKVTVGGSEGAMRAVLQAFVLNALLAGGSAWRKRLPYTGTLLSWYNHNMEDRLAFLTPQHHSVRNFVVRELPRNEGRPLRPGQIAQGTGRDLPVVQDLLDELERNLFFLVRNAAGDVSWAFPVTSDRTPHRLTFSTGERIFGA